MLFAVCKGPLSQLNKNRSEIEDKVDGIELRLDLFPNLDISELQEIKKQCKKRLLFTLRTTHQGGAYAGTDTERYSLWERLLSLEPDYVDLEYDAPEDLLSLVRGHRAQPKLILSYHNFTETPDLEVVYADLLTVQADVYKIATYAHSTLDSLRMLHLMCRAKKEGRNFIGICMGELGQITRILSPVAEEYLTFACFPKESTAPGQMEIDHLLTTYRFRSLSSQTKVYALIGYPIDHTLSPLVHNAIWSYKARDALYIKMPLQTHELGDFFKLFRSLTFFQGLSVTMPLKEAVMPFLDQCSPLAVNIGALNTILRKDHLLFGDNTDLEGALNAIQRKMDLREKKVLILGAGGAAMSIAYGCMQSGAIVHIANRSLERAKSLADRLGCQYSQLSKEKKLDYDLLINTTPDPMPLSCDQIKERSFVMDITTQSSEVSLLQQAKLKNCTCLYGIEMFIYQAIGQQWIWSDAANKEENLEEIIEPLLRKKGSMIETTL